MASGSKYDKKTSENDILKVFDTSDDPFLTAKEIASELPITQSAVNYRLEKMHEKGLVDRKETGARGVGWWALVAPQLSAASAERVEQSRQEIEQGDTIDLEEL